MGALGEVAQEEGRRTNRCSKVLPLCGTGSASFWGGNTGLDGKDAAKTVGDTLGFLEAGDRNVYA